MPELPLNNSLDQEPEDILDSPLDSEQSEVSIPEKVATRTAIYTALANDNGSTFQNYIAIRDSINFGDLSLIEEIKRNNTAELDRQYRQVLAENIDVSRPEESKELARTYQEVAPEIESDLKKDALENVALKKIDESSTVAEKARASEFLDRSNERVAVLRSVNKMFDSFVAKGSTNKVDIGVDLLDTVLPGQQIVLGQVAKEILGEHYYILAGDMERDLGEWIRNHPPSEQVEASRRVLASIEKHSGVIADNDIMKIFTMEGVRAYATSPGGLDTDWQRWVGNIAGMLELTGILPVRPLSKLIRAKLSPANRVDAHSPLGAVSNADAETGSRLKATIIEDDTGQAAKAFDTTAEAIVDDALPRPILDDIHVAGTPPEIVEHIKQLRQQGSKVATYPDDILVFSDESFANHIKKVDKVLQKEAKGFVYHPDKYRIRARPNTDIIEYEAVYGKTGLEGFSSAQEAQESIETHFKGFKGKEISQGNFDVMVHNRTTGHLEVLDEAGGGAPPGDFYVRFSGEQPMPFSSVVSLDPNEIRPIGKVQRWFRGDPHTIFSPDFLNPFMNANDKRFAVKHDLFSLAKSFQKLPKGSKKTVAALVKKGDEVGEVYDPGKLLSQGYTMDEVKGYLSARAFWDSVYVLKNDQARKGLLRDGFKALRVTDNQGAVLHENAAIPKAIEEIGDLKVAYDPILRKEIKLTPGELRNIYDNGGTLVKLKRSIDTGSNRYSHAVITNQSYIEDSLPPNVIYRRPGYVYRLNVEPYYIDEFSDVRVDGHLKTNHTRTIGTASSRVEADRFMKALIKERVDELVEGGMDVAEAEAKAAKAYKIKVDRNIDVRAGDKIESQVDLDENIINSDSGYWFSRRGERLRKMDGSLGQIEDPLKAQERVAQSLGSVVTQHDLIQSNLVRHRKSFPQFYDESGRYIGRDLPEAGNADLKRANAWFNYIDSIRTTPTALDNLWRELMISLDMSIAKSRIDWASKASSEILLKRLSNVPPGRMATGTTFSLSLGLNPPRQLFLQGASGLHLAGIDPSLIGRSFGDGTLLSLGLAARGNPVAAKVIAKAARMAGYNEKEWNILLDKFRSTGKAYSIDSNLYINELNFNWTSRLPETRIGEAAHTAGNILKMPFRVGKAVGFDAGEIVNQATTWSFARHRWIKLNPGKDWTSKAAMQEIGGMARNFAFDMTKTGQLPYQRGGLAAMTQFWAINHKAALNLMAGIGGNRRIKDVWGQYVIGAFAMYGLSGVGPFDTMYEQLKEQYDVNVPKGLDDAIKGGLFESSLNYSIDMALRNKPGTTQLAWSESFSPSSAAFTFATDAAKALISGDKSALEAISGASASTFPNLWRAAKDVHNVWAYNPEQDSLDKIVESVDRFTEKFGVFSNYAKLQAALSISKRLDRYYSSTREGRPMAPATLAELKLKAFFGVKTKSEVELWEKILASRDFSKTLDKDAKTLADQMVRIYMETDDPVQAFSDMRELSMAFAAGNQVYGMEVLQLAQNKYFNIHPRSTEVAEKFLEQHVLFNPEGSLDQILNTIDNSDLVPEPEDKERLKDFVSAQWEAMRTANRILSPAEK